jgi:nicotinate phosphoribosyltransferase
VVLLIDTYDTERAARRVVALAPALTDEGITVKGVRIDSGDLEQHARQVRAILDAGGLAEATIFASGNLDEYRVRDLVARGAPIDGFGIGTHMNTSADAPFLDCVYKLQEYDGRARRKRSEGKATWPGRKQVFRRHDAEGRLAGDTLICADAVAPGDPLLVPVMRGGQTIDAAPSLAEARERLRGELKRLPARLRSLDEAEPYAVEVAPELRALAAAVDAHT